MSKTAIEQESNLQMAPEPKSLTQESQYGNLCKLHRDANAGRGQKVEYILQAYKDK